MHIHIRRTAAFLAAAVIQIYAAVGYYAWKLPDSYYVTHENDLSVSSALPITAQVQEEQACAAFSSESSGTRTVSLQLFGIIPIKNAEVQEIDTPMLIPGGQPFGIKLQMDGVMIIRLGTIQTEHTSICPAEEAGLKAGDIIHTVGGYTITSNDTLKEAISASDGASVEVTYTREDQTCTTELTPVFSAAEGGYAAGIWVRDSLAGVPFTLRKPMASAVWDIPSAMQTPEPVFPLVQEMPVPLPSAMSPKAQPVIRGCCKEHF